MKEQHITCPHCGGDVPVINRLGRKPLNINVKNICDTLQTYHDITLTAKKLGCSRGYIYTTPKAAGLTPTDIIKGKVSA
jgi:hypothetical protein